MPALASQKLPGKELMLKGQSKEGKGRELELATQIIGGGENRSKKTKFEGISLTATKKKKTSST